MISFGISGNGSDRAEDQRADRYCNVSHDRPPCSANVEANGYGEIERFTGDIRRRWREGLRAPHGVDRFLIESRRSRGPYDAARNDLAVAIEREGEFCRTGLVPRAGGGRIAFVALDLLGNSAMP